MVEYIEKHKAVNLLTALENEFQQFKPFKGFEHAMYRKLCETEIAIGKLPAADVALVERAHWIEQDGMQIVPNVVKNIHGMIFVLRIVIAVVRKWRCNTCGLCVHGAEK